LVIQVIPSGSNSRLLSALWNLAKPYIWLSLHISRASTGPQIRWSESPYHLL